MSLLQLHNEEHMLLLLLHVQEHLHCRTSNTSFLLPTAAQLPLCLHHSFCFGLTPNAFSLIIYHINASRGSEVEADPAPEGLKL